MTLLVLVKEVVMRKVVVVMRDQMGAQTEQLTALRLLLIEVMLKKMIAEAIIRVMMKTMLVGEEIGIFLIVEVEMVTVMLRQRMKMVMMKVML